MPKQSLGTILPTRLLVKMPYFEQDGIGGFAASYADFTYSLTSIFDPSVTGTGHQPRGHDQYLTLYSYYRVRKVDISFQAWSVTNDTTGGQAQIVGTCLSGYSAGSSDLTDIIEEANTIGYLRNKYMMMNRAGISIGQNRYTRKMSVDIDKLRMLIFPAAGAYPEESDITTNFGASPSGFNMYFNAYTGSTTGTENVDIPFSIKLMYHVEVSEPKLFGIS